MTFDEWLISRLKVHGVYAQASDGVHGRGVINGIRRFQDALGLPASGRADVRTVAALRANPHGSITMYHPHPDLPVEPLWLREARRFLGIAEVKGKKSNSIIMGWARRIGGWVSRYYTGDDVPWCGLAMAHWIGVTLPEEVLPSNPLSALAWKDFGIGITSPTPGAVMVFSRTGGGHVGLYVGEDDACFHVLGGNQNNSVSITRIDRKRLVAMRWPSTGQLSTVGRVILPASTPKSGNEA